jgi:hypothetical protein
MILKFYYSYLFRVRKISDHPSYSSNIHYVFVFNNIHISMLAYSFSKKENEYGRGTINGPIYYKRRKSQFNN